METWKIVFHIIIVVIFICLLSLCYSLIKLVKENSGRLISEINDKLKKRINMMIATTIVFTVASILFIIANNLL